MSFAGNASRRRLLIASAALPLMRTTAIAAQPDARPGAQVRPGRVLRFPDDEGSHDEYRIEWWYVTGWLYTPAKVDLGFQVTFFRHRTAAADDNPSRFSAKQVFAAHAALSDPRREQSINVQRIRRAVFDRAAAREGSTGVRVGDWSLVADGDQRLAAKIVDRALQLDLVFTRKQPPLLHGELGYSRKGPSADTASYYYSLPQLAVTGTISADRESSRVEGVAWLDHEWSSAYMEPGAVGWDWIGINLDDGGALMAFRMRARDGSSLWGAATHRDADGVTRAFTAGDVRWTAIRQWRSPRTGATYPIAWRVDVAGFIVHVDPMMDDQEQDARMTTGTVYWEGAVTALSDRGPIGRGYLEMTGYAGTLRL